MMATNCDLCYYGYNNHCKVIRYCEGCHNCKRFNDDTLECLCIEIDEDADCPYFVDANSSEE